MPDIDPTALVEITSVVVSAYLAQNQVSAAEIPALIASVHATIGDLDRAPEPVAEPAKPTPAVSVRKSVTDEYLISLEDGRRYQVLKRHLTKLGLTPAEYRAKWGLPADYPMVAPAYARERSELAKSIGLGAMPKRGCRLPRPQHPERGPDQQHDAGQRHEAVRPPRRLEHRVAGSARGVRSVVHPNLASAVRGNPALNELTGG